MSVWYCGIRIGKGGVPGDTDRGKGGKLESSDLCGFL